MGIFSVLKNKFGRKKDDYELDDIRSHVIGQKLPDEKRDSFNFPDALQKDDFGPEPSFGQLPGREPIGFEKEPVGFEQQSRDYDILDKLKMIDAQLSAIRSQTETINERLKNLELKITGRRY